MGVVSKWSIRGWRPNGLVFKCHLVLLCTGHELQWLVKYITHAQHLLCKRGNNVVTCMSRKGPKVGIGMLDFVEDIFVGVKSH